LGGSDAEITPVAKLFIERIVLINTYVYGRLTGFAMLLSQISPLPDIRIHAERIRK
jgi:hypothetical protein